MKKVKVAIIGCGQIANTAHIPAYLKNEFAEIKYFCDIIPERAKDAVEKHGCGIAIDDYMTALKDEEIDAISVCTPNDTHSIITIAALEHGKHVLCEKPASNKFEDALKMKQAQEKYNKTLNIGVVNRFNDGVNKIKDMIARGDLGEVYHVYISFRNHRSIPGLGGAFTTKSISGGGVLIDWGVHFIDVVMYCCGDPQPITVSSETFSKIGANPDYTYVDMWAGPPVENGIYDVEDSITGIVRTEGPVLTFNGAWAQNIDEEEKYIDFMGDKAGIRLYYGADFIKYSFADNMLNKTTYSFNSENMFENEINSFIDCVKTGKSNQAHIDKAIITASIMDAAYKSAEQHREIVL